MPDDRLQRAPDGAAARLGRAMRGARDHLRRPVRPSASPAWTASMTAAALAALALSLALAFLADVAAIELVRASREEAWVRLMRAVTDLGRSQWYLVPALCAFVAAGLADWNARSPRGRARLSFVFGQAAFAFAAVAVSGMLVNVAKFLIGRSRPRLMDEVGPFGFDPFGFDYLYHSFPSGHSTTVGAMALVLMLWFPRARPAVAVLAVTLGFTRVAAHAHYPSDVVAGLAFGFLCSLWLARWLGARGAAFRLAPGRLMPIPRHARVRLFGPSAR